MKKPEVGQTVYRLPIGNAARRGNVELTLVTVTKVGRKYFTVAEGWKKEQFYLDGWFQNAGQYSPNARCYETKEEYEQEKELERKAEFISDFFSFGWKNRISQDALCAIYEVLATEGESQ